MSYPYRVRLKESVSQTFVDSDTVTNDVVLENILSEAEMKDIFKSNLIKRGFEETQPNKLERNNGDGEKQTIDMETMVVTTEIVEEQKVEIHDTREVRARTDGDRMSKADKDRFERLEREKLVKELEEKAAKEKSDKRKEARRKIADKLKSREEARNAELNEAVLDTYKEAVQKRAKTMGNVMEIRENSVGDNYEMIIKITE